MIGAIMIIIMIIILPPEAIVFHGVAENINKGVAAVQ
jgi:hypothetical protein